MTQVIDTIRGSAMYHDMESYTRAVESLLGKGHEEGIDEGGEPGDHEETNLVAVRMKDKVRFPLTNGYRDVLLNLKVPGCPVLCELQLHFHEIHEVL